MKETIDLLGKIITNILTALYEPFGFSLLLSFLAMFFYLYAYESIGAGKGWKIAMMTWYQKFKESVFFRKLFFLAFVTSLILFPNPVKPQSLDESFIRCYGRGAAYFDTWQWFNLSNTFFRVFFFFCLV